jgi:diadenosine tetraphosphate (Ap4A) HIT family hydrolase
VTRVAGWPDDWTERKAGRDCPLCATIGRGDNEHTVAVVELGHTEVGLERRSRLAGYCVVVWRHGHVAEPTQLDALAANGFWQDVLSVARAIEVTFQPVKLNLLTLGNWVPHLHTHVVPRYPDDPAPGGPLVWETIFNDEPTDAAVLTQQAAAIREALAR